MQVASPLRVVQAVLVACLLNVEPAVAAATKVTPVAKAVDLLKNLQVKIEAEGVAEAQQYDRFACFCKDQAGYKQEAVTKSTEKIQVLEAEMGQISAKIGELNGDITTLGGEIDGLETDIGQEEKTRRAEHEKYAAEAKEMDEAIAACTEAIEVLQASKSQLEDAKVGATYELVQLREAVDAALGSPSKAQRGPLIATLHKATALVRKSASVSKGKQVPTTVPSDVKHSYTYGSNHIIQTLISLLKEFKIDKKDLDETEFGQMSASQTKVLGLTNDKTFKEKEKAEKETQVEALSEQLATTTRERDAEQWAKDADIKFAAELQKQCGEKATTWDQRSKMRASELAAIAEAVVTLEHGVLPHWSANKKLVGLVHNKAKVAAAAVAPSSSLRGSKAPANPKAAKEPVSFLQLRDSHGNSAKATMQRALDHLDAAAHRLQSSTLEAVAVQMQLGEDHFVKVRTLIKDLISRLDTDAQNEETMKTFCDTEMEKAITSRDAASLKIEDEKATISENAAEKAKLLQEIDVLNQEIAELYKALKEAADLRAVESLENKKTMEDAKTGKEGVEQALTVLRGFYDESGFVQVAYSPPKGDRYNMTVEDYAPEVFEGDYTGKKDAGSGVIGILEVVLTDFERTLEVVGNEESTAQSDYIGFKSTTEGTIKAKEGDKKTKKSGVSAAEQAIVSAQDNLYLAEKQHESALAELEKLSKLCVEGEETWEERKAKRDQEIAALKEAYRILDEWKSG